MSSSTAAAAIPASARAIQDWIVERRRHLHRHPELSFREERTAAFVERELRWLGFKNIQTQINGKHSLCAELLGRDRSRCVALRADMDALPIQEETEWTHQSQVEGVSHMCGHDAHTSMLLGAARLLKEREAELPCTVRLFFQGGEERLPGGARDFIAGGLLEGVDSIYGLHVDPRYDTGTILFTDGASMAGVDEFTIHIYGKGGHAAFPHQTVDPVLAAAHVVTALQQIVSRTVDPFDQAVVSVTQISAGEARNVIPEKAVISGTYRSFRPDIHAHYSEQVRRIAASVAEGFGCRAKFEIEEGYPPLTNDADATERMRSAAGEIFAPDAILNGDPIMASEDFAIYTREVPGCFAFLGVASSADTERYMLHHPRFHIDEDALWRGSAILAQIAMSGG